MMGGFRRIPVQVKAGSFTPVSAANADLPPSSEREARRSPQTRKTQVAAASLGKDPPGSGLQTARRLRAPGFIRPDVAKDG